MAFLKPPPSRSPSSCEAGTRQFDEVEFVDRHGADAHRVLAFADREAGSVFFEDEGRDAADAPVGLGEGVDREHRGHTAVGVPLLVAVEDVLVAVTDGGGAEAAGVGP